VFIDPESGYHLKRTRKRTVKKAPFMKVFIGGTAVPRIRNARKRTVISRYKGWPGIYPFMREFLVRCGMH
jgi:hypothetical protein